MLSLEQQFETERDEFKCQINEIERRWNEFEYDMGKSGVHAEG